MMNKMIFVGFAILLWLAVTCMAASAATPKHSHKGKHRGHGVEYVLPPCTGLGTPFCDITIAI